MINYNKLLFPVTAINGQVYGIDSCLEPAHFITDILSNDSELFLISQDGKHDSLPDTFRSNSSEGKSPRKLFTLISRHFEKIIGEFTTNVGKCYANGEEGILRLSAKEINVMQITVSLFTACRY